MGIHLKAQDGDPKSDLKRLAEAEQTRKILQGLLVKDASAAIVVLGDSTPCRFAADPGAARRQPAAHQRRGQRSSADRYSVTFGGNPQLFDDQLDDPNATALLIRPA